MADKPLKRLTIFYLGFFVGLIPIANIITIILLEITGIPPITHIEQNETLLATFITICILPAIWEELLFRGILQTLLSRIAALPAVIIPTILFTALHIGNPAGMPAIFILSLALSIAMLLFNNIFYVMALHCVNNIFGYTIYRFNVIHSSESAYIATLVLYAVFIFTATTIIFLGRYRCLTEIINLWKRRFARLQRPQNKKKFR